MVILKLTFRDMEKSYRYLELEVSKTHLLVWKHSVCTLGVSWKDTQDTVIWSYLCVTQCFSPLHSSRLAKSVSELSCLHLTIACKIFQRLFMTQDNLKPHPGTCPSSPPPLSSAQWKGISDFVLKYAETYRPWGKNRLFCNSSLFSREPKEALRQSPQE